MLVMAMTQRTPTFESIRPCGTWYQTSPREGANQGSTKSGPIGITAAIIRIGMTLIMGARRKTHLSAPAGIKSSLKTSFTPSAAGCMKPIGPTRFGPTRCCKKASSRRSSKVA